MTESEARISLRVYPGAARSEVVDFSGGVWRVRVAAPPVKGKANRELIALLSRQLARDKRAIAIISGHTSRNKIITVAGLTQPEVMARLQSK
jgi:hypothetical protein